MLEKTIVGMACTVVMSASHVMAADILVPQDASTIQDAINLANTGDRVLVSAGTYSEQIDFAGKDLVIESVDGPEVTIIDGNGALGHVVTLVSGESTNAALRGFTVRGGFGEAGSMGAGPGGGVLIDNAALTIDNCIIADNTGILGGGVHVNLGEAIIRDTRFSGNHALQGGGFYIEQGDVTIENSEFHGNSATTFGGAMAIFWLSNANVSDTQFTENIVINAGLGGAVYANHATIDFSRLTFADNGKATALDDGVSYQISTGGGGAVYTTSTNGRIDASRMERNVSAFGSALYVAGSGTLEVVNTLIAQNAAECQCGTGTVYANASSPVLTNCTIADNGGFVAIFTTYNAFPTVNNSIIVGQQNTTAGNGSTTLGYSLLQGTAFAAMLTVGNISPSDAMLDASADYAPLPGSPAIDAGDNTVVPADITTDLLGNARFVDDPDTQGTGNGEGALVDIGAIEFQVDQEQSNIVGDMTGDGTVGVQDLLMLLGAWGTCHGHCPADLNTDSKVNVTDLMILLSNWG
jgi:hypothetical protein